jgi:hypothetical protein
VRQTRDGRRVGGRLNIRDVLSEYAQSRKRFQVERLDHFDWEENAWREALVEDTRTAGVPEIVSFRVDLAEWLRRLSRRDRRLAHCLALGNRTGETARRFGLSHGRISKKRRELFASWMRFHGEPPAEAPAPSAA